MTPLHCGDMSPATEDFIAMTGKANFHINSKKEANSNENFEAGEGR